MHHAAEAGGGPMMIQDIEKIIPRVGGAFFWTAMNENGPLTRRGDFKLRDEARALRLARCAFVVVVEADLAAGNHLGLSQKTIQLGQRISVGLARVVRIDSGTGVEARHAGLSIELAADVERLMHFRRTFTNSDGQHRTHARSKSALQHRLAVVRVALAVQMGVGIDEHSRNLSGGDLAAGYLSRAPSGTSSRNPASTGAPSGREAASSMPFDSKPRIL